jgi:glutathione S-transferase
MKLYYIPGACSAASHIMLRETGRDFELESVSPETGKTGIGKNFRDINPKGHVPALELENGDIFTEGAAVLQFIADSAPDKAFSPKPGSAERARLQEHLNYTSSELHKAFTPLFKGAEGEAAEQAKANVKERFSYIEGLLSDGREFLVGNTFSAADAYLFVVANWANFQDIDLTPWPRLSAFIDRVLSRPSVQMAFKAEGLV